MPLKTSKLIALLIFAALIQDWNLNAQTTDVELIEYKSLDLAIELADLKLLNTLHELGFNPSLHPGHTDKLTGKWDTDHLSKEEWTSGFFSGSLWYMYQITGDESWRDYAKKWTENLEPVANHTGDHDTGFRIFNSFGNGYRLVEHRSYYKTILRAASTLATRFNPKIGAIKSWDWIGTYPVIIDNLINLELLFWASNAVNHEEWYEIAKSHADVSLTHHMRPDGSSYHIVDFDNEGNVIKIFTTQGCNSNAQGCGPNSVWARGQAWAIYGFTMIYRYTNEERFLNAAISASDYFISNLPSDFVPIYDFLEPIPSVRSKDVSASAIAASGLFELYSFTNNNLYYNTAVNILESLTSDIYSNTNTRSNAILRESTLHRGKGHVGTSYADYYYLEAIVRYMELNNNSFPEIEKHSLLFLDQNYPNPFNNITNIFYSIEFEGLVDLSIYDVNGRKIQTLTNRMLPSGSYRAVFNGSGLSSGLYFYVLRVDGKTVTNKMTLLK